MELTLSIDTARELLAALGLNIESPQFWRVTDKGVVLESVMLACVIASKVNK